MSSLRLILVALAIVAAVGVNSSYTCIGNPYFNATFNPNPFQPGTTNITTLAGWNVTYNSTSGIYDLSGYNGSLPACQNLKNTGSCCGPDYINQSVQAYSKLFNATSENVIGLFNQRINKLKSYASNYGKIVGTLVDVITRGHQIVFKIVKNVNNIVGDSATLLKLTTMASETNATALPDIISGNFSVGKLNATQLAAIAYQSINIIGGKAGINQGDIVSFFGSLRALETAFAALPYNLFAGFNAFPSVSPALISDAMDAWSPIFIELGKRTVNLTLTINIGGQTKLRRMLQSNSQDIPVPFPVLLDPRNIEAVATAFLDATKKATNATQFFQILLNNASSIYKAINATWYSKINSFNDIQTPASWPKTKQLAIQVVTYAFNESLSKLVTVAQNKKKCMNVVFQYTGYLSCLACDASALTLGKIAVNKTAGTFSPVVSSDFGRYIQKNCSDYLNDLQFINAYLQGLSALNNAYNVDGLSKKDASKIDTDISKAVAGANASSFESKFNIPCSVNSDDCNWAQNNLVDALGATVGFLCDFDTANCGNSTYLSSLRRPSFNNGNSKKRMLDASTSSTGSVQYSDNQPDEVSTTNVGFSTQANYTINSSATANVTADSTPNTDTSNTTNASNNTNNTNGTKFGLKGLVSIPLILATIVAFLL